jgi:hypothetical protein
MEQNELNKALEQLLSALKDYNKALVEVTKQGNALVSELIQELEYDQFEASQPRAGQDPDDDEADMDVDKEAQETEITF